jgi:Kef-type K+ transport system membrane component KefB
MVTHSRLRTKLEAMGYGIVIPVFFVARGLRLDLSALLSALLFPFLALTVLRRPGQPMSGFRTVFSRLRSRVLSLPQDPRVQYSGI